MDELIKSQLFQNPVVKSSFNELVSSIQLSDISKEELNKIGTELQESTRAYVKRSLKVFRDDPNKNAVVWQNYLDNFSDKGSIDSVFNKLDDMCENESDEVIPDEVIITTNKPVLATQLQDIVYIGDRKVEFYRYFNTLYIVDPEQSDQVAHFTIEDLPHGDGTHELPSSDNEEEYIQYSLPGESEK